MSQLTEDERTAAMNDINGHYNQLLVLHPGWQIEEDFGQPELLALEAQYIERRDAINQTITLDLNTLRAQRDALFGTSGEDVGGVWHFLPLYKGQVGLALTRSTAPLAVKQALKKTVPNVGVVRVSSYDAILFSFIDHWRRVNTLLPPDKPLTIGDLTLAQMSARRAQIAELSTQIDETHLTELSVMRAEREAIFGDVRADDRLPTSVLARLLAYELQVRSQFPGTPLEATLPDIFPKGKTVPTFKFNFAQVATDANVWFAPPENVDASVVFLKEGAFEQTQPMPTSAPFRVTFTEITVVDGLDEVELRDEDGRVVAHGKFDAALPDVV